MRTFAGLALFLSLASCAGSSNVAPRPGDRAIAAFAELTARLDVRRYEAKPPLATIVRDGDPAPALAAVLVVDDEAMGAAPSLAAVIEDRLRERGAEARVTRGAVVVTWDASGSAGAALRAFATAMSTPITVSPSLARRAAELAGAVPTKGLEAAARCSGTPDTADGVQAQVAKPEGAATVDSLRRVTATAERASIAIVGPQTVVDDANAELQRSAAWPLGEPARRGALAGGGLALFEAAGPATTLRSEGGADLVLSIELGRAAHAPDLARSIADPTDPVATQLALLGPRYAILAASGVARAGGAGSCLRVDLRARRPEAFDADAVGWAARVVRSAAERSASPGEAATAARSIVTAGDAREAAARAAWWTTTADGATNAPKPMFVAISSRPGKTARFTADEAKAAVERIELAPARATPERRVRQERGQGALVMAAGSPCPIAIDTRTLVDSAALALGLVTAARRGSVEDVELTPFLGTDGAGLVARAEPRPGEDGGALATRVARALGAALGGRPPAVAEVERTRARLVERAATEWGYPETSEALIRAVAAERPLALAPLGIESALVRAEAAAAVATLADVLAGPVRVAVLTNDGAQQAERAIAALEAQLPPTPPPACPAPALVQVAPSGRVDVRVAGDERFAQLALANVQPSEEAAEVALAIVEADGSEVVRAAASVGASVRAHRVGSMLIIDVRVAPERTDDAHAAIGAALDLVARSAIDEARARRMVEVARSRLRLRASGPVARAIELWRWGNIREANLPDPRAVVARLAAATWVVVVARPS